MRPRQFALALVGAIVGWVIGWVAAGALHVTQVGGGTIVAIVGIAVGIGVGRYLGRRARLKATPMPVVENPHHEQHHHEETGGPA